MAWRARGQGLAVTVRKWPPRRLLLGICLGMQSCSITAQSLVSPRVSFDAGTVVAVPSASRTGDALKFAHRLDALCCWRLRELEPNTGADLRPGDAAYFVHSFMASPTTSVLGRGLPLRENPIALSSAGTTCSDANFTRKKAGTRA